jgi:hypothetical protein
MNIKRIALKPWQEWTLYLTTGLLWISGALWLYYKYYGQVQGEYGAQASPVQPILLEVHGAVAMAFLIVLGSLFVDHVPMGWKQKKHRPSGLSLLSVSVILILTGWGLYYLGDQNIRRWTSVVHWGVGLAVPVLLFLHVRLAIRQKKFRPHD